MSFKESKNWQVCDPRPLACIGGRPAEDIEALSKRIVYALQSKKTEVRAFVGYIKTSVKKQSKMAMGRLYEGFATLSY